MVVVILVVVVMMVVVVLMVMMEGKVVGLVVMVAPTALALFFGVFVVRL